MNKKDNEKLMYSIPEFAELFGISHQKAFDMAKRGELPIVEIDRKMMIPAKELSEWLSEQVRNNSPEASQGEDIK